MRSNTVVLYWCIKNDRVECVCVCECVCMCKLQVQNSTTKYYIEIVIICNDETKNKYIIRIKLNKAHNANHAPSSAPTGIDTKKNHTDDNSAFRHVQHYASMNPLQFDIIRTINNNNYNSSTIRYRKIYIIYNIINRKLVRPYVKYMKHQMCIIFVFIVFLFRFPRINLYTIGKKNVYTYT